VNAKARSAETPKRVRRAKRLKCPVCGKPAARDYGPFCSRDCADIDLGRWLTGRYVVPGEPMGRKGDEDAD
jgi:endogenous inhibitor of DNA gyrase (YacG/DUF329 family)